MMRYVLRGGCIEPRVEELAGVLLIEWVGWQVGGQAGGGGGPTGGRARSGGVLVRPIMRINDLESGEQTSSGQRRSRGVES